MSATATAIGTNRRLTGLKPTGRLQLGNLIGAIAPMVAGQRAGTPGSIVAIVDLHALTVDHRPHDVRALTLQHATTLLAAGVDPAQTMIYVQSQLPEHTELHYLLECVTGFGEAQRMIQFREGSAHGHTRLSLLTYPVLMAADILLHDTDEVPVGDDQRQHLELARAIATRFNGRYGDTFTVPRAAVPVVAGRIMNLADPSVKMGKSSGGAGVLHLLDPPDLLSRKIRRAVTDGEDLVRYDPVAKPGVSNLLDILAACTGRDDPAGLAADLGSYRQLKTAVTEAVITLLAPIQRRYHQLARDPAPVHAALAAGRDRARGRAAATVARARRALGLLPVPDHRPSNG
jgi:tryptophanyl-tRNA synthetase